MTLSLVHERHFKWACFKNWDPVSAFGWETPPLQSGNKLVAANGFTLLRIRRWKAQRDLIESHTAACCREVFWKLDIGDISAQALGYSSRTMKNSTAHNFVRCSGDQDALRTQRPEEYGPERPNHLQLQKPVV